MGNTISTLMDTTFSAGSADLATFTLLGVPGGESPTGARDAGYNFLRLFVEMSTTGLTGTVCVVVAEKNAAGNYLKAFQDQAAIAYPTTAIRTAADNSSGNYLVQVSFVNSGRDTVDLAGHMTAGTYVLVGCVALSGGSMRVRCVSGRAI